VELNPLPCMQAIAALRPLVMPAGRASPWARRWARRASPGAAAASAVAWTCKGVYNTRKTHTRRPDTDFYQNDPKGEKHT
jgi:hypothetical protein